MRQFTRRSLSLLPTLAIVTVIVFGLTLLIPGDPAQTLAGEFATPERVAEIRVQLRLDDPVHRRYLDWLGSALTGDLGNSFVDGSDVRQQLVSRFPVTASLGAVTLLYATVVGLSLGMAAGYRAGTMVDRIVTFIASVGLAIPHFWLGMLLILWVSLRLGLLPAVGYRPLADGPREWISHLLLPAVALGSAPAAEIARQTRATVQSVADSDYVRTAYAKGLRLPRILTMHIFRNACMPVLAVLGIQAVRVLSAAVVIEQIFALPGYGSLAFTAVVSRDFPVIQGLVLVTATLVLLTNLIVDTLYSAIDPRVEVT